MSVFVINVRAAFDFEKVGEMVMPSATFIGGQEGCEDAVEEFEVVVA